MSEIRIYKNYVKFLATYNIKYLNNIIEIKNNNQDIIIQKGGGLDNVLLLVEKIILIVEFNKIIINYNLYIEKIKNSNLNRIIIKNIKSNIYNLNIYDGDKSINEFLNATITSINFIYNNIKENEEKIKQEKIKQDKIRSQNN